MAATIVISLILALIAGFIIFRMVRNRLRGKGGCGCGCSDCGAACCCNRVKDKK